MALEYVQILIKDLGNRKTVKSTDISTKLLKGLTYRQSFFTSFNNCLNEGNFFDHYIKKTEGQKNQNLKGVFVKGLHTTYPSRYD